MDFLRVGEKHSKLYKYLLTIAFNQTARVIGLPFSVPLGLF